MPLTQDTSLTENENNPDDPQKIGSGRADAPGGSAAPPTDSHNLTHGQEAYPGVRAGHDSAAQPDNIPDKTPDAGDLDPGASRSAEETGQDGNVTDRDKAIGNPWNG